MKTKQVPQLGAITLSLMLLAPAYVEQVKKHFNREVSKVSTKSIYRTIASDDIIDQKIEAVQAAKEKIANLEKLIAEKEEAIKTSEANKIEIESAIKIIEEEEIPEIESRQSAKVQDINLTETELTEKKSLLDEELLKVQPISDTVNQLTQEVAKAQEKINQLQADPTIQPDDADLIAAKADLKEKQLKLNEATQELNNANSAIEPLKEEVLKIEQNIETLKGERIAIETELENKKSELETKKQELAKVIAEIEQLKKELEQAQIDLKAAQDELAKAKEDLTNDKKVTELEEENTRQMREIDVLKCSSPYQLANYMAHDFMSFAQLEISQLLLNMNAMMSALTLEARYDGLFYAHKIGQIPNINTLLGTPQSIVINNYSGDFSRHSSVNELGEKDTLEEELINATNNKFNPFSPDFGSSQFFDFEKYSTVNDIGRKYDFSNFENYQEREKLHIENTILEKENDSQTNKDVDASLDAINDLIS